MGEALTLARASACWLTACSSPSTRRARIARPAGPRVLQPLLGAASRRRAWRSQGGQRDCLQFWRAHRAEFLGLLLQHLGLVAVSTLRPWRSASRSASSRRAGPASARRSSGSPTSRRRSRAWRCSASCCRCRSSAASARASRSRCSILYALLPILRTTVAGMRRIDPALVEAGTALGMTPRQLLRQVELPLALPSIVAGHPRRGGHRRRHRHDRRRDRRRRARRVHLPRPVDGRRHGDPGGRDAGGGAGADRRRRAAAGSSAAGRPAISRRPRGRAADRRCCGRGCGAPHRGIALRARADADAIRVGSKNFTEQIILGELLAQTLERTRASRSSGG